MVDYVTITQNLVNMVISILGHIYDTIMTVIDVLITLIWIVLDNHFVLVIVFLMVLVTFILVKTWSSDKNELLLQAIKEDIKR